MDFRGAMKQSEVLALDVLKTAEGKLEEAKNRMTAASGAVAAYAGTDPAERATLELARDEELRRLQAEEKRYQIAKDLSDNLTVGYNTSEVIMARLVQTTNAKERIYAQSVSFFGTNEVVLTALTATFTGMHGLHESTQTLEAMKKGVDQSPGSAGRDRRQGAGSGPQGRLWPDDFGGGGEEAGRTRWSTTRSARSASSPKCASWRRRTRPKSATRSKTARSGWRSWLNRARPPR